MMIDDDGIPLGKSEVQIKLVKATGGGEPLFSLNNSSIRTENGISDGNVEGTAEMNFDSIVIGSETLSQGHLLYKLSGINEVELKKICVGNL